MDRSSLSATSLASDPECWVDEHGDALYRFAMLRLNDPDRAADAVQDALLEALRCRASYTGRASPRTWLIAILKHKIVDQRRRLGRERELFGSSAQERVDEPFDRRGHWRVVPRRWTGPPHAEAESREFWVVFSQCASKLPDHIAEAFLGRELEGLSHDELCQRARITPGNLSVRLHRARLLLRACLERHWFREVKDEAELPHPPGQRTEPEPGADEGEPAE